jgi:hypothetical protein
MKRSWLYGLGAPCLAALLSAVSMPGQTAPPRKEAPTRVAAENAAPKTQSLGTVGTWSAYAVGDRASRICYLVGRPQKIDSAGVSRQAPVAMVTHRPSENIANVVSFVEGYPLKTGSEVALEVDDRKFDLFTSDDSAWAHTAELDRAIVTAFVKGKTATVKGTPNSGKATTDIYSLAGFTRALALIDEACGINRPETAALRAAPAPQTGAAPAAAATAAAGAAATAGAAAAATAGAAAAASKASASKTPQKKTPKKASKKRKKPQRTQR